MASNKPHPLELDNDMMFFIVEEGKNYTLAEMTAYLRDHGYPELTYMTMYNIATRRRLEFKPAAKGPKRKNMSFPPGKRQLMPPPLKHIPQDPEPEPPKLVRPPAVYNQSSSPYGIATSERHL